MARRCAASGSRANAAASAPDECSQPATNWPRRRGNRSFPADSVLPLSVGRRWEISVGIGAKLIDPCREPDTGPFAPTRWTLSALERRRRRAPPGDVRGLLPTSPSIPPPRRSGRNAARDSQEFFTISSPWAGLTRQTGTGVSALPARCSVIFSVSATQPPQTRRGWP
jgi:hypothetical protein